MISLLLKWKEVEVRKIRNGIEQAVRSINERHVAGAPEVEASEDMYFDFRLPE